MISVSLCVIAMIARRAPRLSLNALNLSFNAPYETALCRERTPVIFSANLCCLLMFCYSRSYKRKDGCQDRYQARTQSVHRWRSLQSDRQKVRQKLNVRVVP